MFVERLNSKQNYYSNVFAAPELREKCAAKSEVFYFTAHNDVT